MSAEINIGINEEDRQAIEEDPIRIYFREIGQIPIIDAKTEIELAKAIKEGKKAFSRQQDNQNLSPEETECIIKGKAAREKFIEANLRLVVSVAKKYMGRGLGLLDMIQEGNIGLTIAVDKFDHERGFRFSTYATWRIRRGITNAIADQASYPRLSPDTREKLSRLFRIEGELTNELKRNPTAQEIAAALKISENKYNKLITAAQKTASLDIPIDEDGESPLIELLVGKDPSPEQIAQTQAQRKDAQAAMDSLSKREKEVLALRFGFYDDRESTLEELADKFSVTIERISQIQKGALKKLERSNQDLRIYIEN